MIWHLICGIGEIRCWWEPNRSAHLNTQHVSLTLFPRLSPLSLSLPLSPSLSLPLSLSLSLSLSFALGPNAYQTSLCVIVESPRGTNTIVTTNNNLNPAKNPTQFSSPKTGKRKWVTRKADGKLTESWHFW